VTLIGLLLTPVFYVVLRSLFGRRKTKTPQPGKSAESTSA